MARRPLACRRRRQFARLGAVTTTVAGLVLVAGVARGGLLVAAAALCVVLMRLPRLEARMFGVRARAAVPVRAEVWTGPNCPPRVGGPGLGVEGHRAYAHALHAVTGAYLAECEREAGR